MAIVHITTNGVIRHWWCKGSCSTTRTTGVITMDMVVAAPGSTASAIVVVAIGDAWGTDNLIGVGSAKFTITDGVGVKNPL